MNDEASAVAVSVKWVLLELQSHHLSHRISADSGADLEGLIAAGVFSDKSIAFLRSSNVKWFGYNPDLPGTGVLVARLTKSPGQMAGYADGRVEHQR